MRYYIDLINRAENPDDIDIIMYRAAFDTRLSDFRCHTVYVLARKKKHELSRH